VAQFASRDSGHRHGLGEFTNLRDDAIASRPTEAMRSAAFAQMRYAVSSAASSASASAASSEPSQGRS